MAVSIVTFALATAWPMASSLADLKASSHSLQTQQNIDLNPKKLSHPKNIDPCHLSQNLPFLPTFYQKTFTIVIDIGIESSQTCGLAKKFFEEWILIICWKLRFVSDASQQSEQVLE